MYDDSWYNALSVSSQPQPQSESQSQPQNNDKTPATTHHRRQSRLLQLNGHGAILDRPDSPAIFKDSLNNSLPSEPTIIPRATSYTDFHRLSRSNITTNLHYARQEECQRIAQPTVKSTTRKRSTQQRRKADKALAEAANTKYQLYADQLAITERHLDTLIQSTTSSLQLLSVLSDSFKSVEAQTTAFQSQCQHLLVQQKNLKSLAEEVGDGLHHYSYLEPITRRLNVPGASRAIGDDSFVDILSSLETCIDYMSHHPDHRESEVYLTRYKALLVRTLNLLRLKFNDIMRQDTQQALARIPENKMNMTTVFVVQAPQRNPTANELDSFMSKLRALAYSNIPLHDNNHNADIKSLPQYVEVFSNFVDTYITWRRSIITPILDKLLSGMDHADQTVDAIVRTVRDSFQAVLEVAANEDAKYTLIFTPQTWSRTARLEGLDKFAEAKAQFPKFLSEIIASCLSTVKPRIQQHLDMSKTIELVSWLGQYDITALVEDNATIGSHDDDIYEQPSPESITKSRLVLELKTALTEIVFERLNITLFTDVEKYIPHPDELRPRAAVDAATTSITTAQDDEAQPATTDVRNNDTTTTHLDPFTRAENLLGPGLTSAYAPVKTAVRLLTVYNDLTRDTRQEADSNNELASNIIHQTCLSVTSAATVVAQHYSKLDSNLFAIKNLVLLKTVILTYEIEGQRRDTAIDFSPLYSSYAELRERGGLFDVRAYYDLFTTGRLIPRFIESIFNAVDELDGLLRAQIMSFREEAANMLVASTKTKTGGIKGEGNAKEKVEQKLNIMFNDEDRLRDNLWEAVMETIELREQDASTK